MSTILAAILFMQAAAAAPPQRPPASNADLPAWTKTPSADDMTRAYPAEAAQANLAGSATIECTVGPAGQLVDCVAVNETPAQAGFAAAALAVSSSFQMPLKSPSGASTVGRTVQFPIRWLNPAKTQAPPITVYDDAGRTGQIVFNCRVKDGRGFDNCVVVDAKPPGSGLFALAGEAALRAKAPGNATPGSRLFVVVAVKQR